MPDSITLDDGIAATQAAPAAAASAGGGITLDDALAAHEQSVASYQTEGQTQREGFANALNAKFGDQLPQEPGAAPGPARDPYARQRTPEILGPERNNFGASVKGGLADDPQTKRRLIASSMFPDDPNGASRIGFVDGTPVYVDDSGNLRRVSGRMASLGASMISNAPETAGAIAGSFATGNPVAGAAVGSMGGKMVKRGVMALATGEPVTTGGVLREAGTEGALNLVMGGAAKGLSVAANKGAVVDFTPSNIKTATQVRDYVKQTTGIDLDLAQASGNRKLIAIRNYAAQHPSDAADLFQAADEAGKGQFEAATTRVLDKVAAAAPSEVSGENGVNAASMVIKLARANVNKQVAPLYDAAYAAVPEVSTATKQGAKILDYLKLPYFQEAFSAGQKLRALETGSAIQPQTRQVDRLYKAGSDPGSYQSATTAVSSTPTGAKVIASKLVEGSKKETPDGVLTSTSTTMHRDITRPSLAELDYTKRALDERIESLIDSGQRQRARALTIKRNEFVDALDALPNQEWQKARQTYGQLFEQNVAPLENGAVGVLSKIKDGKTATAAAKILQDPNITAGQIAQTRQLLEKQQPDAFNGLVRQWLGQKWNRSLKETQTGDTVNPAGKFRQAVFGTPDDKAKMRAMLGGASQDFEDLMLAAEKLASTPIRGSNTAPNLKIEEALSGTGVGFWNWFTSPKAKLRGAIEQKALDQGVANITEAILDPAKRAQLRRLVKLSPTAENRIRIGAVLTGELSKSAVPVGANITPESTPTQN